MDDDALEAALRAQRVLLSTGQAFWERNLRTGKVWLSPHFFGQLGIAPTDDRDAVNAHIHPDDRAHFEAAYAAAIRDVGPFSYEMRWHSDAGEWRWRRAYGRVWPGADGQAEWLAGILIDVHAEKTALQALEAMAARYDRAMEASSEAHFERTVGQADFFASANLPAMLGHPPGTPAPDAETYFDWVHPDDRPGLVQRMRVARSGPGPWDATYRLRTADGHWRWFRGRGRSEPDGQGGLRMSGMLGDIHEQVLAQQELERHRNHLQALVEERTARLDAALQEAERQRTQADAASRAKSQFLAHMSHEIRTPLNGVLGLTELALRVAESPGQRRYLEVALNSGQALLGLISHVLDMARIESGQPALVQAPFDMAELLADVLRGVAAQASAKGLLLHFDWTGGESWVRGDAVRVRQVVTNLVGNAVKFTDQGEVRLLAGSRALDGGSTELTLRVEDTGPGIDPTLAEHVFHAFSQGDASLSRRHGGAGLGLTIARSLAEAMGGQLQLAADQESGSTFTLQLTLGSVPDPAPLPAPAPGRVWIVHPDAHRAAWLQRRFERLHWTAEHLPGIGAAIDRSRDGSGWPQLVLALDPSFATPAEMAALRGSLPGVQVALLVHPDWDQPALERVARQAGLGIVLAPATPRDLLVLAGGAVAPPLPTAPPAPPAARTAPLGDVLLVEDNPVNLMIVAENLRQLGFDVRAAEDGQRALAACAQAAPRLVLMDLQMPVMDGVEATRRLRASQADGRLPAFPIVGLTAHALRGDHDEAIGAGMDLVLTKPILREALARGLSRFVPELAG